MRLRLASDAASAPRWQLPNCRQYLEAWLPGLWARRRYVAGLRSMQMRGASSARALWTTGTALKVVFDSAPIIHCTHAHVIAVATSMRKKLRSANCAS